MTTADELRDELQLVKGAVNQARVDNALADNDGRPRPYSDDDLLEIRRRVHEAAALARADDVDISDLVGPRVGAGDFPG